MCHQYSYENGIKLNKVSAKDYNYTIFVVAFYIQYKLYFYSYTRIHIPPINMYIDCRFQFCRNQDPRKFKFKLTNLL